MTTVFSALIAAVAYGRWANALDAAQAAPPSVGCSYVQQRGKVLRRGKVLECLRPVAVTLEETLLDPPCCVKLRLRWRLEPIDSGSFARLDARYSLNGAASLRARHWSRRIRAHCTRMLSAVQTHVERMSADQRIGAGVRGHSTGSSDIATTKMIKLNGKPSRR
jgi:hypothetical protein